MISDFLTKLNRSLEHVDTSVPMARNRWDMTTLRAVLIYIVSCSSQDMSVDPSIKKEKPGVFFTKADVASFLYLQYN